MSGITRSAAIVTGFAAVGLAFWIAAGGMPDWQGLSGDVPGHFPHPVTTLGAAVVGAATGIAVVVLVQFRRLRAAKTESRIQAALMRALNDVLQDLVMVCDGRGICRRVIALGCRDLLDLLRPRTDSELAKLLPDCLAGPVHETVRSAIGSRTSVGFHVVCPEVSPLAGRSFEVRATPLPNSRSDAEPTAVVLVRETTDAKRAERVLRLSEGRLNAILNNTPTHIYLKDLEGRYTTVNRAFMEHSGLAETDIIGKRVGDVFPGENPEYSEELDSKVRTSGRTQVGELELHGADGTVSYGALLTKFPVWDGQGRLAGTGGVSVDITDLKRLQSELRAAKDNAEAANAAKSAFLANMSHELRTPLNSIIGFSDIIAEELMGPLGHEKYREYANDVRQSGQDLLQLINDILDISRIEAGGMVLREDPVYLPLLLSQCERIMAPRFRDVQVDLRMAGPPELPSLRADEHRVKQVIFNLLSNAMKFTPPGGVVSVSARVEVDGGLAVVVRDTGIGMASGDIEKALLVFAQLDDALTRRHEGAGLGLPLSKRIVELHGGTLEIVSEKGRGTEVTIHFPAERTLPVAALQPQQVSAET